MSKLTVEKTAESQSATQAQDPLLCHDQEIGISALVAALNMIAEVDESGKLQAIEPACVSIPAFLLSDDQAA